MTYKSNVFSYLDLNQSVEDLRARYYQTNKKKSYVVIQAKNVASPGIVE